jgi:protein tyrosine/serine phosphatase
VAKWMCVAALLSVSPCTFTGLLNPDDLPANFHTVADGAAYRSAQPSGDQLEAIFQRYGVKTVINLRGVDSDADWWKEERDACENNGVALVNIGMNPKSLPSREDLLALFDTFQSAAGPILIHCKAGADRTGAAATIWRMVVAGDPKEQAKSELSFAYLHLSSATPHMDFLVDIFQADRNWILNDYDPNRPDQPVAPPF